MIIGMGRLNDTCDMTLSRARERGGSGEEEGLRTSRGVWIPREIQSDVLYGRLLRANSGYGVCSPITLMIVHLRRVCGDYERRPIFSLEMVLKF